MDIHIGCFVRLKPQFATYYNGRASMWHAKEDYQRALQDAKEAVRLAPENKSIRWLLDSLENTIDSEAERKRMERERGW